jgi:type VI secretion system protein ImpI
VPSWDAPSTDGEGKPDPAGIDPGEDAAIPPSEVRSADDAPAWTSATAAPAIEAPEGAQSTAEGSTTQAPVNRPPKDPPADGARSSTPASSAPDQLPRQPGAESPFGSETRGSFRSPLPETHGAPAPREEEAAAEFLDTLAAELGIPREVLARKGAAEAAREVAGFMRASVEGLQALLKARAASRGYMRAGRGTSVEQIGNNPLKFLPTAQDALAVLLGPQNPGYLSMEETLEETFRDLGTHQVALYAAMQQAVRYMLEDLNPSAIEDREREEASFGRLVSSRKARLWEIYKERYAARESAHDNGMVDVFLLYFSEAYAQAINKS